MTTRSICIHGHFYQPPRENPWLEAVELQDSAFPYHDWNERVTAECYAPNAHARLLDDQGRIARIVNNYARISFNFGPTVLSWMKVNAPDVHAAIQEADKQSQKRFSGHGSAIAQCYNHLIMPLANQRDKRTQVLWGIRDFQSHFERFPEGMWLPECAADTESLEVLAELGIKFAILSPFQAKRIRALDHAEWQDVNGGRIDPSRPYLARLPSNRSIAVFFYDAPVSQAVAFERLLTDGRQFALKLAGAFNDSREWNQLVHIATDGESYGHHFIHGDMALAYALNQIRTKQLARLTIYGEHLAHTPPTHEVEIHEASSWSCPHGVDRWRRHCGCNSGGYPGWNQNWRQPLREAMDWLRDQIAPRYEVKAREFLKDPWAARDDYVTVVLDRSPENVSRFFIRHATRELDSAGQTSALRLLEMQRHAMLMYTSCGWFFDDLSGIETVQAIQYAARALQLFEDLSGESLEPGYLDILERARSNLPENGDGRQVYEKFVKPAITTREKVTAHYAVNSLFEAYPETARIYSFKVRQKDRQVFTAGRARLAIGSIEVRSEITCTVDHLTYGVVHLGDQNLNCGVRSHGQPEACDTLLVETRGAFERSDFPELVRIMDRHFGATQYSLKSLFRDKQRKVLDQILSAAQDEIHNAYRHISDQYTPLMRFLGYLHVPAPKAIHQAIELVTNGELRRQFDSENVDLDAVRRLLADCQATNIALEKEALAYSVKRHLERLGEQLLNRPDDLGLLQRLADVTRLVHALPFEADLWKPQNVYDSMLKTLLPAKRSLADHDDPSGSAWVAKFENLGEELGFRHNGSG
jgi:alpha-amylase/alpha-mannosidase (GH57 family)